MKPIRLSPGQRSDINLLLTRDRLKVVPVDLSKAKLFVIQAEEAVSELGNIQTLRIQFDVAYDFLRETRNGLHYQAKPIGRAQTDHAIATAKSLLAAAWDILN